jgi:hypothetical protein
MSNPNQASDGRHVDQFTYDEAKRQRSERLERAAVACPAWEDGRHCFQEESSEDEDGGYVTPRLKACCCGAELRRLRT